MITVPQNMQLLNTSMFTTNGIEAVTATVLSPNACRLQFLSALVAILNHVAMSDIPTVVWVTLMKTYYESRILEY